jgi:hypothetical protein
VFVVCHLYTKLPIIIFILYFYGLIMLYGLIYCSFYTMAHKRSKSDNGTATAKGIAPSVADATDADDDATARSSNIKTDQAERNDPIMLKLRALLEAKRLRPEAPIGELIQTCYKRAPHRCLIQIHYTIRPNINFERYLFVSERAFDDLSVIFHSPQYSILPIFKLFCIEDDPPFVQKLFSCNEVIGKMLDGRTMPNALDILYNSLLDIGITIRVDNGTDLVSTALMQFDRVMDDEIDNLHEKHKYATLDIL